MLKSAIVLATLLSISNPSPIAEDSSAGNGQAESKQLSTVLSSKSFSLEERYESDFVNGIFKDNILLTLNYMSGLVKDKNNIKWDDVKRPRTYLFSLQPGESFAFHDQILAEFDGAIARTMNAHFNHQDGFKSDGYLTGDGVCHLASLLYWASKDAGLMTIAPTDHDFAEINEIPKEYGVSIYNLPGGAGVGSKQNLYITNNLDKPVSFVFAYDGTNLKVEIGKSNF